MIPRPDVCKLDDAARDALILSLIDIANGLSQQVAVLEAEVAALKARLGLPPKTPGNSGVPLGRGRKRSDAAITGTGGGAGKKGHAGAARQLAETPTGVRQERVTGLFRLPVEPC